VKIESDQQFFSTFGKPIPDGYLGYAVTGFFENGGRTCWVVRAGDTTGARPASRRLTVPGRQAPLAVIATSDGAWGNLIEITPRWTADRVVGIVARAPDRPAQILDFDAPASLAPDQQPNLLRLPQSALPELQQSPIVELDDSGRVTGATVDLAAAGAPLTLSGGQDGSGDLTLEHLIGDPDAAIRRGAAVLDRVDSVSLIAVPDLFAPPPGLARTGAQRFTAGAILDAQTALVNQCLRRGDRMAILDAPPVARDAALRHRQALPNEGLAALYHPWVAVRDPHALNGLVRFVPPSGHVAGMIARVDRLRGVHKPPANEVLEGVFDLAEAIDDTAHGQLNERAINAIRVVPGRGVLVLGARTLSLDYRWRYVNVRRLFTMIGEALDSGMQWAVFEPNNPQLWRHVDRAVRGFLERLYRVGMLDGATSDDAYAVRCDDTTNPPDSTDTGRLTCVVGLQPPYPAEFVVVRIGVTRSGIQIEERGTQDV
jgi:phage tail sheath protein FI